MLLVKIGVVFGRQKYEHVFNLTVILELLPGWLVRRKPLLPHSKKENHEVPTEARR